MLATRVQMGSTAFGVVSDLVAKGYANLTHFTRNEATAPVAHMCHFPDPVCARLAMCLMDDTWKSKGPSVSFGGLENTFWVAKMQEIFSTGLCRPPTGDFGEVLLALYLLLCGDVLRKAAGADYRKFRYVFGAGCHCLEIRAVQPPRMLRTRVVATTALRLLVSFRCVATIYAIPPGCGRSRAF